ncbi:MAG: RtcB family protein [Candidatus Micrarchaeia archaeon]
MAELKRLAEAVWQIERKGPMRVPVQIYATEKLQEQMKRDRTFWQASNVAQLPGIVNASFVMPDGHEGYGFPIGGVAAFDPADGGIISPGGVGYDINCGVRLLTTPLTADDVRPKIKALMRALFENVPSGVGSKGKLRVTQQELDKAVTEGVQWAIERGYGSQEDAEHCEENGGIQGANPDNVSDIAKKRGLPQFGTLGAGNHFLEVQRVERVMDEKTAKAFGISQDQVVVMVHCGSRGFGHQVCDDYIRAMLDASRKYGINLPDKELCCAPIDSPEAKRYISAMYCAVNYAFLNRHIIAHWVRETFGSIFGKKVQDEMKTVYDVCHNIAKLEEHEVDGKRKKLWVHRKGATRAFWAGRLEIPAAYRSVGQPVIIPGSMGTASYLLVGTEGGKECWGTTCHGAGRTMSRNEAIRTHRDADIIRNLEQRGISVMAASRSVVSEEAPDAYKDVDEVVRSVELAGISRIVSRHVPLGVAKG